jgi:hypothetical protein
VLVIVFDLLELELSLIALALKVEKTLSFFAIPFLLCFSPSLLVCFGFKTIKFRIPPHILKPFSLPPMP